MKRYWLALAVAIYFYAKMDILIWQRIFETHQLFEVGDGTYHWGWLQSLFGFMILGILLCYPSLRMMITFPFSLAALAFSGLEDILYYWLDSKPLPPELPWLSSNPLLLKPVTVDRLIISALFWILVVVALDVASAHLENWLKTRTTRSSTEKVVEAMFEPIPVEIET